ncbi:MAG: phospholipase D family protein [Planctomycetota bacterium]|nr:phospholipase D family protein [Planctomycetota bacterium]
MTRSAVETDIQAMPCWLTPALPSWIFFCLCCLVAGCGPQIESHTDQKNYSKSIQNPEQTYLGKEAAALAARHPEESGFLLLDRGAEAMSWRLLLSDASEKTIDAQYFLWKNDLAGQVFMQRLLAAAQRGIRVRVLLDDSMTEADPVYLAKFGAHPNIELRLYKPFGPKRKSTVLRWLDYARDLEVLNQRMHNKLFIVDGSMAIVGGRNIANEYFEYPGPYVFRCRDLLAVGPIVRQTNSAFDLYWNSDWTVPIEQVVDRVPDQKEAEAYWKKLGKTAEDPANYPAGKYDDRADGSAEIQRLKAELHWGPAKLLVDKVPTLGGSSQAGDSPHETGVELSRMVDQTEHELQVETAYLILLEDGFAALERANERGVKVTLATNSLASNNHVSSFVGYRKQRRQLLATGAELFEMRPDAASERALFTPQELDRYKTVFGLHCKTAVFDRKHVFVGSFNMDPRSTNLNTEMGFLVESPTLADAVLASIQQDISPGDSWQVVLQPDGRLAWITRRNGEVIMEPGSEPMATRARRVEADLLMPVPDDSQL